MRLNPNSRSFSVRTTITTRVSGKKMWEKATCSPKFYFAAWQFQTEISPNGKRACAVLIRAIKRPPPAITVRCDARVFLRQTAASLPRFSRRERVRSCALFHGQVSRYNFEVRFVTVSVELSTNRRLWKMIDDDHRVFAIILKYIPKVCRTFFVIFWYRQKVRERFLHQLHNFSES